MKTVIGLALLMLSTSAFAQAERTFQVQSSLAEAPCEAWVKEADGTWAQAPNTVIVLGGIRVAGTRFKGGSEGTILDRKCSK